MRKLLLSILFSFTFSASFAQCGENYCIYFDDTTCMSHLTIDTPHTTNIWQIGNWHKSSLDTASCLTKLIITDTVNPYPVNNTSSFTLINQATMGDYFGLRIFSGSYYVQSDSLNDFGTIEISLDKGQTWIDIINDTVNSNHFLWWSFKPVLTGHSMYCIPFSVDLADLPSIHPFQIGDTIMYRFTFHSDSVFDNMSGLMFDDLCISDFVEGVSEIRYQSIHSKIYPNPNSGIFNIDFENPQKKPFKLAVYTLHSKPMFNQNNITSDKISLDLHDLPNGMYIYKIYSEELRKRCWGRISIVH